MTFRRYNLILASILVPVVLMLVATSFFLQPYDGGLTRLGGYPEKLYGWTVPQQRFPKPLYRQFKTREAEYREPADVILVGDSFTFLDQVSWPNFFARQTGLRVQSFRLDKTPVSKLIDSETWRQHPPKIFIYESVERILAARLNQKLTECQLKPAPMLLPLGIRPLMVEGQAYNRDTRTTALDFSMSIDFLTKTIPREYFGRDRTKVARVPLGVEAPFSNVERRQLLVYKDDLKKRGWSDSDWETIRCNFIAMQNRVQANGKTFFVAMVAPDKLTAYSELLADRSLAGLSRIDRLAVDSKLHLPRFDRRLQQAVREGVVDVYLNNDTHWGSVGSEMVARDLVAYLRQAGVLVQAGQ